MKKLFIFLSIICLLTGCSNGGSESSQVSDNQTEETTSSTDNQNEAPTSSTDNQIESNNSGDTGDKADELNELYNSAILQGDVVDYSDTGCKVEQIITSGEDAAYGAAAYGDIVNVTYSENTEFEYAVIKSYVNDYTLEASDISSLSEGVSILVYGSKLDDGSYSADKIIVVEYDYS